MADPTPQQPAADSAVAKTIARAARRVRLLRARHGGANGLMIGSGLAALVLLAERLRLLESDAFAPELLILPPLVGLAIGAVWGLSRPVPPLALLKHLETRLDLKERLSTAFLLPADSTDPFIQRQRADAEVHAATDADLRRALPFTPVPRRVYCALAVAGATFLLWFLPTLPLFQSPAERAEKASLKRDGERLMKIAKKMEVEAQTKRLDAVKAASLKLAKLGEEMQKGRLTRQKAMMQAAKLTEELKQAQQALAQQTAPKSLPSAARDLRKSLASSTAGNTSRSGENKSGDPNAENKLNAPQGGPKGNKEGKGSSATRDAMNQATDAMANNNAPSLAEQLSKMADSVAAGKPETDADRREMARQISSLADALKGTSYEAASQTLKEAAEALKSGDTAKASEKLRKAARKIADAAKNADTANAMNKMADALSGQSSDGETTEGEGFEDSGEGQGDKDAFGKSGQKKGGHVHTAECLKPGGT